MPYRNVFPRYSQYLAFDRLGIVCSSSALQSGGQTDDCRRVLGREPAVQRLENGCYRQLIECCETQTTPNQLGAIFACCLANSGQKFTL